MRGGRLVLLSAVLLAPLALADAVHVTDPLGDELTVTNLRLYDAQPMPLECHDASVDVASVIVDRGAMVRASYRFFAPLAMAALECNGELLPSTDRTWNLHLGGQTVFTASVTSTSGAPEPPCLKANSPNWGNSVGCATSVTVLDDGFEFSLASQGTLLFEDGLLHAYALTGDLNAHPSAWSRATVGASPIQRVLYGAYDWTDASLAAS